ncbi:hypothetical protein I79_016410 [Cricetulus griseus]|uniref:Uncharacterized protein n=1 Tax=Cricetulus griseus TaxID=10029 RepID=G3HZB3_CRIGR|nr:hypothetical protein I79_016410 [Cricetulus griseus]
MEKPILYEALRQYLTRSSTKPELPLFSVTLLTVLDGKVDRFNTHFTHMLQYQRCWCH